MKKLIKYDTFITAVLCKDCIDFHHIIDIKIDDFDYVNIICNNNILEFIKNEIKYIYIAVYSPESIRGCVIQDFIITDDFKYNPDQKLIIKSVAASIVNNEILEDFSSTVMHVVSNEL